MNNSEIFQLSEKYMPGGVNSPVRAFKGLDMTPPVIKRGEGAYIYDEDGKEYIDFVGAWGPMLLGHKDEDVINAMKEALDNSLAFGAPTLLELELAKFMCKTLDNIGMVRMVNSGTEATMSAVKLARGYTGRDKIIKFSGCYHGHFDGFLVSAGSGVLTGGIPGSAGVPKGSISNTLVAEYNNISSVKAIFNAFGQEIAAVIIEPVAGNMGVIKAEDDFMREIRALCDSNGSLLIFDEVMSGFRVAYKGAQTLFDVKPDLVTYAKIMGGGMPCGAYGGRREIMEKLSPSGPIYQAGTMSGNPIVMTAGIATLKKLYNNSCYYDNIEKYGALLEKEIRSILTEKGIKHEINRCGGMMTLFFTDSEAVKTYDDVKTCDIDMFNKYFSHMLKEGIYLPPSQYEAMFLSVRHGEKEIEGFAEALRKL
ncbi:glutamate-1-semialdehyde 2,1-aminomutase [Clostridium manihotivorum]|uniref:Glutamate-1-semialdehyde 2,1-aminomutase n=1 Tax=Clostridium manihotivorum TaxID=2320868 RepID=A0A3R5UAY6_9CLOT|nr:glutamate-1-semialdehyde 2,1-aminomutase [Clostridium manihotivorum]QAA34147.1 glutamate-1-semialdehyde-2,1-aminomutase [Clostridium manihotivorum]